ncbi:hypothetical protein [Acinetobacter calcoaceticus]|uniref:AbiTii domain-containing protein n=1 Tax=Acinetobacter calcoaceticus TaxID=471 RepID=UPI001E393701|nr:hypothetical protein [Acinetobacter calcoaceticus]UGQ28542.1 hypothetical protein LRO84_11315 [Acinetobacter calcoaceticus]
MSDFPVNQKSLDEALALSEEILKGIELANTSLVSCTLKASRLARLLNDFDYQRIFSFESSGYPTTPNGISADIWKLCQKANRTYKEKITKDKVEKEIQKANITSVGAAEIEMESLKENLRVAYDPNISISSANPNQYVTTGVNGNAIERKNLTKRIQELSQLLDQRRGFLYEYVSNKNYELKYSKITSDIFSRTRSNVDSKIGNLIPLSVQKFASVYDNLNSDNTEDWSNAVHSCRRILQDTADVIYPAREDKVLNPNSTKPKVIKLGTDNYINRLIAYVEENTDSKRFEEIVGSHMRYLGERLDAIFQAAQKGSHDIISTREEADRYVIYTYLVIGDILSLRDEIQEMQSSTNFTNN